MKLTEEELVRWGRRIGETVEPPVVLALRGPLGAGKSVLARAVAQGAGVEETMPSPTFNLLFRYRGREGVRVAHLDLYRIRAPTDLWEIGWEEIGGHDEIVLVEWPERAGDLLPSDRWDVELGIPEGSPLHRDVSVTRVGTPAFLAGFPIALTHGLKGS